ncbi:hormogonium polysaccharide biosynthesis glycosyltransferase HpsO [Chroococcus sp. FPU101]|uniref:hormogonium polysaccharide biosynthesis glycosyltransferase HpsO n=1 Tax=Chroococcus sp. FPU101 TaxID=1974212 RepID=UPI001A8D1B47|nr:hormogonium polysaccharide biosynthesis glycosyltransferase HpsO [Chroococcus sp. FPU101]GFE67759.1 glycosyl transferase group 1 [Chroococcus sp. FPU101]
MKILVASHTYIVELNCEKLKVLTQIQSDIEVTVVVPKRWQPGGVQNKLIEAKPWQDGNFRVVPISNFSQNNQPLLTFGTDIITLLKEFRPNIIQVEQGSKSIGYAELITLNNFLGLKAKNCFFTWWNLPYTNKFPISWIESYNLKHTDGLVAGNQDAEDILRDHGYTGPSKVMPQLGVDEKLFSPAPQSELAAKLGIKEGEFIIGFVGRFVPEKGILTLIKALAGLSDFSWKCLLLGRGTLKETILSEATAAGIQDRIILVESVPHDEVPCYINLMSTLVLPSETSYQVKTLTAVGWKEQFGHVLIEAMACKVPVIGSNSGEIPYVIEETGLIFPEGDSEALQSSLRQLLEQPELCQKLAQLGYDRVMNQYTNQALAKSLLDFYQEISQ